jgi:hypothetical protein
MPGKSRHKRGKRPFQSRKSKAIVRQSDVAPQQVTPEARQAAVPRPATAAVTKPAKPAAAAAMPSKTVYPYVKSELSRIGLLGGTLLIILIVLSFVLR